MKKQNNKNFFSFYFIYIIFLILFIVISNIIWLKIDTTPQRWDESIHLNAASSFAETLKVNPFKIFITFITQESYYPPLVPLVGAFFGIFYPDQDNFTYSIIIFHIILILFTFLYTRKILDNLSGICAATFIASYPLVFTEGHFFMFDLPLTAMVAMALYFLNKTNYFFNKKYTFIFFTVCGFAMLIKWNFIIYFITPFLMYLFLLSYKFKKINLKNFFQGFFIFSLIVLPWYSYNFFSIIKNVLFFSFKRGKEEGLPDIFTFDSFIYYLKILPEKITFLFFVLFIISLIFLIFDKQKRHLILYFLVPVLILTLLQNKKDRYLMPVLPFCAIITSYSIYKIKNLSLKKFLTLSLILLSLLNYIFSNFNLPFNYKYSARPNKENWQIKNFLEKIDKNKKVVLSIVPDHPFMNSALYSFYTKNFYKNIQISGIFNFPSFSDYFIIKTGYLAPNFSAKEKRENILNEVLNPSSKINKIYEKIYETVLPDNSKGMLYKLKSNIEYDDKLFIKNLNKNIKILLSPYLKNIAELDYKISKDDNSILIKNLSVLIKNAIAGDFKHKDIGLRISEAEIKIDNLLLDPFSLEKNELQILKLEKITIKKLKIEKQDLKDFLKQYIKGSEDFEINFEKENIELFLTYKKIPIYLNFFLYNPFPYKDNSDLSFKIKKIKISFLSIPSSFSNFLLKDYNPILVKSNSPFKVNFGNIKYNENFLEIN